MCQTQAGLLKDLKKDLEVQAVESNWDFDTNLNFVCVNHDSTQDRWHLFQIKSKIDGAMPVIQDEHVNSQLNIWNKYSASKDDIYVIDRDGKVAKFFAKPDSFLNRSNVKDAIQQVLKGSPCQN